MEPQTFEMFVRRGVKNILVSRDINFYNDDEMNALADVITEFILGLFMFASPRVYREAEKLRNMPEKLVFRYADGTVAAVVNHEELSNWNTELHLSQEHAKSE
jgi:hypothetical protein